MARTGQAVGQRTSSSLALRGADRLLAGLLFLLMAVCALWTNTASAAVEPETTVAVRQLADARGLEQGGLLPMSTDQLAGGARHSDHLLARCRGGMEPPCCDLSAPDPCLQGLGHGAADVAVLPDLTGQNPLAPAPLAIHALFRPDAGPDRSADLYLTTLRLRI